MTLKTRTEIISRTLLTEPYKSSLKLVSISAYSVILTMIGPSLSTAARGDLLLDLEIELKEKVDARTQVFLEPKGDMNKLRIKLRGVKI